MDGECCGRSPRRGPCPGRAGRWRPRALAVVQPVLRGKMLVQPVAPDGRVMAARAGDGPLWVRGRPHPPGAGVTLPSMLGHEVGAEIVKLPGAVGAGERSLELDLLRSLRTGGCRGSHRCFCGRGERGGGGRSRLALAAPFFRGLVLPLAHGLVDLRDGAAGAVPRILAGPCLLRGGGGSGLDRPRWFGRCARRAHGRCVPRFRRPARMGGLP